MRLAWLTDVHLNFLPPAERQAFASSSALRHVDGVVITGDIAEASSLIAILDEFAGVVQRPVWFVLGNHDFYGGAIDQVRAQAAALSSTHRWLRWLPAMGSVRLTDDAVLVGQDGWGDARLGNVDRSQVELSDFSYIADLRGLGHSARRDRLRALGD